MSTPGVDLGRKMASQSQGSVDSITQCGAAFAQSIADSDGMNPILFYSIWVLGIDNS